MAKKITAIILISLFCMASYVQAQDEFDNYVLYIFDELDHLPRKFRQKLQAIKVEQPEYSYDQIMELVVTSYYAIRKSGVDVSMYEVADGVRRFSDDNLLIDMEDLVSYYVDAKLPQS